MTEFQFKNRKLFNTNNHLSKRNKKDLWKYQK